MDKNNTLLDVLDIHFRALALRYEKAHETAKWFITGHLLAAVGIPLAAVVVYLESGYIRFDTWGLLAVGACYLLWAAYVFEARRTMKRTASDMAWLAKRINSAGYKAVGRHVRGDYMVDGVHIVALDYDAQELDFTQGLMQLADQW